MGFLPQFYVIKDALLMNNGEYSKSGPVTTRSPVVNITGKEFTSLDNPANSNCSVWFAQLAVFASPGLNGTIYDSTPFQLFISSDSNENKLIIDSADKTVNKSYTNSIKSFENGKCYCNVTYTNSGEPFDIACVRIAINNFMIYAQSIDPITIGTGETVQIKIEV